MTACPDPENIAVSLSRRSFLLASTAALGACAARAPRLATAASSPAAEARRLYDAMFEQLLAISPETATGLGLDVDARAALKGRLFDRRRWGRGGTSTIFANALPQLRALDAARLPLRDRAWRNTAIWYGERALESRSIPYGSGQTPYVLTQLYGATIGVPNFLDTQHNIVTAADAEAYLARLDAFHRSIDAEVEAARADAAMGVIPPDFVIDKALAQTRALLADRGGQAGLVQSLADRARKAGIAGDWQSRAVAMVDGPIAAAVRRQEALLGDLRRRATPDAGVSRLPLGDQFYAQALRYYTSTDMTPQAVHRLGLDEVARLTAKADPLLRAAGIAPGPIGRRIAAIEKLPGKHLRTMTPGAPNCWPISAAGWTGCARAPPNCSTRCRPARWRCAACQSRSRSDRPGPMPRAATSKAPARVFSTSICRTSAAARASACRR
jgi:uncharacterized protein (DUF885 family)